MIDIEQSVWEQRNAQGVDGMVKTRADLDRYEKMLAAVKPAWVVECGTYNGRSACWFADTADCRVVTIDTHPQIDPDVHGHRDITWLTGNSTDLAIVDLVRSVVRGGGPVVVVLDSDHSAEHVYAELLAYSPLVTKDSYVVIEDGVIRWVPEQLPFYGNSSPLDAIEKFLANHPDEWAVDTDIENQSPTTQHPSGFVRRVA